MKAKTNLTMLCDFYELTMANGYFQTGLQDRICYFDVFYRSVPDKGGLPLPLAWPRWWNISRNCGSMMRTWPICGPRAVSARSFWRF